MGPNDQEASSLRAFCTSLQVLTTPHHIPQSQDTAPEERFDDLTRLACMIFKVVGHCSYVMSSSRACLKQSVCAHCTSQLCLLMRMQSCGLTSPRLCAGT